MSTSHRRVIEAPGHSREWQRLASASIINDSALYVGSVGIQLKLYDYGKKISYRIAPTEDTDVVMEHSRVEELAAALHSPMEYFNLKHSVRTEFRNYGIKDYVSEDPFQLIRLQGNHPSIIWLFKNLDIFTERTGIGPIPITDEVLEGHTMVNVDGISAKVAAPFFIIASQTNPFAVTEKRAKRLLFFLLQAYSLEGRDAYMAELGKAIEYLGYGNQVAASKLEANILFQTRKEFTQYERMVRGVGYLIGTAMKNKLMSDALSMHISERDATDAREITARAFASYESPRGPAPRHITEALRE